MVNKNMKKNKITILSLFLILSFNLIFAQNNSFFEVSFDESFSKGNLEFHIEKEKAFFIDKLETIKTNETSGYISLLFTADYSDDTFFITSSQAKFHYYSFISMNKEKWLNGKFEINIMFQAEGNVINFSKEILLQNGSFITFHYDKECNCLILRQQRKSSKF